MASVAPSSPTLVVGAVWKTTGKTCTKNNVSGSLFDAHLTRIGSENLGQNFLFWHCQLSIGEAKPVYRGDSFIGAEVKSQRNFESSRNFLP